MKSKANLNTKKVAVKVDENYLCFTGIDKDWNIEIAIIDVINIIKYIVNKIKTVTEKEWSKKENRYI